MTEPEQNWDGGIWQIDPEPLPRGFNVRAWPAQTAAESTGSGDERDRATVLYRLATIAIAFAASHVAILTGAERVVFCSSCGEKTPAGIGNPRHKPHCLTAEIIRLVERLRELEPNLRGEEEAEAEDAPGARDGIRARSTIREPWTSEPGPKPGQFQIIDRDGCRRAIVAGRFVDRRETAERIVACVNLVAEE